MTKRRIIRLVVISVMLCQALVGRNVLGSSIDGINSNIETNQEITTREDAQDFFEESRSEYETPISEGDGSDLPPPPDPPSTVTTETSEISESSETSETSESSEEESTSAETTQETTTAEASSEEETVTEATMSQPTLPSRPSSSRISIPHRSISIRPRPREIAANYLNGFSQSPLLIQGLRNMLSVAYPIPDFLLFPVNHLTFEILLIFVNL